MTKQRRKKISKSPYIMRFFTNTKKTQQCYRSSLLIYCLFFISCVTISNSPPILVDAVTDSETQHNKGSNVTAPITSSAFVKPVIESLNTEPTELQSVPQMTLSQIFTKAGRRGIGGGIPGAIAGVIQVVTLIWLRTITNYQFRYGTTMKVAMETLYKEGGIPRFYKGLSFALVQAPLARFVSTAANDGVESLMASLDMTKAWGPGRTTIVASFIVGFYRMLLMPIDTCKTVLQVDSEQGFRDLIRKVKSGKISVLYQGGLANAIAAICAHYPWFFTYNTLSRSIMINKLIKSNLLRHAGIGFISSAVSDTLTNSIRVVKTTKQSLASKHIVSYGDVIFKILSVDGWKGLFGRGLRTRVLGNAIQSVLFTTIWRGLAERRNKKEKKDVMDQTNTEKGSMGDEPSDESNEEFKFEGEKPETY